MGRCAVDVAWFEGDQRPSGYFLFVSFAPVIWFSAASLLIRICPWRIGGLQRFLRKHSWLADRITGGLRRAANGLVVVGL